MFVKAVIEEINIAKKGAKNSSDNDKIILNEEFLELIKTSKITSSLNIFYNGFIYRKKKKKKNRKKNLSNWEIEGKLPTKKTKKEK